MYLNDFKREILKKNEKEINQLSSSFINEISETLDKNQNDICVVYGIKDEKLTLINIENGEEFNIYISISEDSKKKLHQQGIDNIFDMDRNDFYNIDLGTKLEFENGNCKIYEGEIEIKDSDAWYKLQDLYDSLKEDENQSFIVREIIDNKIFLTYEDGGGDISIYREIYPDLKVGDILKKENGKYIKKT